ncbi:MAG TPA: hypothetical protein VKF35_04650 [Hyphomicrobiaceae bacterium]|jgi:hypothetical protein|nr:hypothetical protein [Hyphomicrobiaceae bacterium]
MPYFFFFFAGFFFAAFFAVFFAFMSCPSNESPESSPGVVNVEIFKAFYKRIFPLTSIDDFDRYISAPISQ